MNRLEAGALGYPTLAGKSSSSQLVGCSDLIAPAVASHRATVDSFDCDLPWARRARDRTANSGRLFSEQALLIAAGSRREYSIGHGDSENGVYAGGFPGKEEISASNAHQ